MIGKRVGHTGFVVSEFLVTVKSSSGVGSIKFRITKPADATVFRTIILHVYAAESQADNTCVYDNCSEQILISSKQTSN